MYVDESGIPGLADLSDVPKRYLGLQGVIVPWNYAVGSLGEDLQRLKWQHFEREYVQDDPDRRTILHRNGIKWGSQCFKVFKDEGRRFSFDLDLLHFLIDAEIKLATVILDKQAYVTKYGLKPTEKEYHHCMCALINSYCTHLHDISARGDIIAEGRGQAEDKDLKDAYIDVFTKGYNGQGAGYYQAVLSSGKLDVRHKKENIYGLQLADLLAYPCTRGLLVERGLDSMDTQSFSRAVLDMVENKYLTDPTTEQSWGLGKVLIT